MPRQATATGPEAERKRQQARARYAAIKAGTYTGQRVYLKDLSPEEAKARLRGWRRTSYANRTGKTVDDIRRCANRDQMQVRLDRVYEICAEYQPVTVRQAFYRAEVEGIVGKTDPDYQLVAKAITRMRMEGRIPWEWIRDPGRVVKTPPAWRDVKDFFDTVRHSFRLDYWQHKETRVQLWCEKDALASTLQPLIDRYRIPLVVARGLPSWSLMYEAAAYYINTFDGPTTVLYLADFDPKGQEGANFAHKVLKNEWFGRHNKTEPTDLIDRPEDVEFKLLALNKPQIAGLQLPTRPTKHARGVSKKWLDLVGPQSCELDAIDPHDLRLMVEDAIEEHMMADEAAELREKELKLGKTMRTMVGHKSRRRSTRKKTVPSK
jgi:hypothetical protein